MNTKKEDGNDIDIDLVKDNYSTQPSEKLKIPKPPKKQVQKNQNHNIIFKESLQDHKIGLILILTVLKTFFRTREPDFSKGYTLNEFQVKHIRIGFHFMFHLHVQNLQVMFNLSPMPLLWPTINMAKTFVVSVF